jgi:hypothetical protein
VKLKNVDGTGSSCGTTLSTKGQGTTQQLTRTQRYLLLP